MSDNRDTESAWQYHELTKHSYWSVRTSPHFLDFDNKPSPFKIYPSLDPIPLSRELLQTETPALTAISESGFQNNKADLNIANLSAFLFYTAGVTKKKTFPGGEIYFRAAACAGALYPVETYLVSGDIDGIKAGVYHFNPGDFSLRRLREGDYRRVLAEASAGEPSIAQASAIIVYSAMSWRSTWKYRDRAYRYHFWDNGMIAANALAMSASHRLSAKLVMGFVEDQVNRLIGIDGKTELALSLLALGTNDQEIQKSQEAQNPDEINLTTLPLSVSPVEYASIQEMHRASSLADAGEVARWREGVREQKSVKASGEIFALSLNERDGLPDESIESVIQRRASTRRFARKAISFEDLSVVLDRSTRGLPADFLNSPASRINDIYLIINRVEGLEPGAYFYNASERHLELLDKGDFSERAAYLVLEQPLGGDASVTMFFMADLNYAIEQFGNRGYRVAQMESGIIGGKSYIAAYTLGCGATGLTFYDDDVTEFFSPHAAGKSCMLAVSIGIPGKRPLY